MEFEYVIIIPKYYTEISRQLIDYGVKQSVILDFSRIYEKMTVNAINNTQVLNLLADNIPLSIKYDGELERLRTIEEKTIS